MIFPEEDPDFVPADTTPVRALRAMNNSAINSDFPTAAFWFVFMVSLVFHLKWVVPMFQGEIPGRFA
jgi:hypothetical protein